MKKVFALLLTVAMFATMSVTAFAAGDVKYGIGFTTGSNLRLRSKASTGAKVLDTAEKKGEVVVLVSKVGDWYKVIYNLQEGYMHGDYIDAAKKENAELGYGKVNGTSVNMRSGAGTKYSKVAVTKKNDKVYIIGINNGWYKVIFGSEIGYIRSDYVDLTEIPYENQDSAKSPIFYRGGKSTGTKVKASALNNAASSESSVAVSNVTGADIVATAKKYLGAPYKYGGKSPSGFDCSGFVYYVYRSLGIKISRTQATMYKQGTPVSKSDLQPGDLVFFQNTYKAGISHVGIYVGNGKFIHSPSSGKVVSYANLNSKYYVNHYYGAARYTK